MTTTTRTRLTRLAVVGAVLPLLAALVLVRPASGQEAAFGLYAVTAQGGPAVLGGDIGAGGGLTVLDGGAPFGALRLDSSPSSSAKAAAVEPGTLARTVVGVANTEAGETVVEVPTAEASYPGDQQESQGDALGSIEEGGGRLGGATARVEAHQFDALVRAEGGAIDLAGAVVLEQGTLDIVALADPSAGTLSTEVVSRSGKVDIGGVLVIESVVGTVRTTVTPDGRTVEASTIVSGATVGGVPVQVTEDGVVADGSVVVPSGPLGDAGQSVNDVLANAGITVETIATREDADGGSLVGDAGGVRITLVTDPNQAVAGNTIILTLGSARATSADEPPAPSITVPPVAAPAQPGSAEPPASTGSTTGGGAVFAPAPPVAQAPSSPAAPEVAQEPGPTVSGNAGGDQVLLAGRRLPARAVLAAFGGWQLLSLSTCTLAVYALRRDAVPAVV